MGLLDYLSQGDQMAPATVNPLLARQTAGMRNRPYNADGPIPREVAEFVVGTTPADWALNLSGVGRLARLALPAAGLLYGADAEAGRAGGVKSAGGRLAGLLGMDDASRAQRMADQGYERGYWRAGWGPADGEYYTRDIEYAKGRAGQLEREAGKPVGSADLREYALRPGATLSYAKGYSAEDLAPIVVALQKQGYKDLAKYLPEMAAEDYAHGRMPGQFLMQLLDRNTGDGLGVLRAAGIEALDTGRDVIMFNRASGGVRDANKAVFDPKKRNSADPFAGIGIAAPGMGGGLLYGNEER